MKIPEYFRDRLFKALVGPVHVFAKGDTARQVLEDIAARQLEDITPVLEQMLDWVRNLPS